VVKNPNVVMRTLMKISGGTRRFAGELSIDSFVEQADSFGKIQDEGPLGRYITIFQTLFRSHPFPIWRTKEILDWVQSGNYLEILDGDYRTRALIPTKACPQCSQANKITAMLCTHCGFQLMEEPSGAAAEEAARQVSGGDTIDPVTKAWSDVRAWYKRKFTVDGPWEKGDESAVDSNVDEPNDGKPS
jgi:hypothetical protein